MKRIMGAMAVAVAGAAFLLLPSSVAGAQTADLDCSDFTYQEDAQDVYDADPSDPHGLDNGGVPGKACEHLPPRPTGGTSATPVGGVQTGLGGTAPGSDSRNWAPLAAAAVVAAGSGAGFVVASRRP